MRALLLVWIEVRNASYNCCKRGSTKRWLSSWKQRHGRSKKSMKHVTLRHQVSIARKGVKGKGIPYYAFIGMVTQEQKAAHISTYHLGAYTAKTSTSLY